MGRLEPTRIVATSPPPPPICMDAAGRSPVAKCIFAAPNASRSNWVPPGSCFISGINTSHIKVLGYVFEDGNICHLAALNNSASWVANPRDSESLAIQISRTLPGPGRVERTREIVSRCDASSWRHAVAFIIAAVRSFASAALFSSAAARSFCAASSLFNAASLIFPDTTIAYVAATPTINAATSIQLAQENILSADIPSPFLWLFLPVCLVVISGIAVMIFLAPWKKHKGH
jgi:hypothetical protein